jgi:hypothetical protein
VSRSPIKAIAANTRQILGVGQEGLAWAESGSNGKIQWRQLPWASDKGAPSASAVWANTLDQRAWSVGSDVVVCLDATLVNHWLQPVPAQTQSLAELHAVAGARAKLLFGGHATDTWLISGDWDYKRPFLCTAIASVWGSLLNAVGQTHKQVRIVSTLSLVLSEFAESLPKNGWLAIVVEDRLHLVHHKDGYLTTLRSLRLPECGTSEDLETVVLQEWNREKIRTQLAVGKLHRFSMFPTIEAATHVPTPQKPSLSSGASLAAQQAHHIFSKVVRDAG